MRCLWTTASVIAIVLSLTVSGLEISVRDSHATNKEAGAAAVFEPVGHATTKSTLPVNFVMPWLCLGWCKWNSTQIEEQIHSLIKHRDLIRYVSFEMFNLQAGGTFTNDGLTNVAPILNRNGIASVAMVTSVSIHHMRDLFNETIGDRFLASLSEAVKKHNLTGLNFDFEPTSENCTAEDAANWAKFLGKTRRVIGNTTGAFVSVDVAEWSAVWNWTEINAALNPSESDGLPQAYMASMSTYTYEKALWTRRLETELAQIDRKSLIVGLDAWHSAPKDMPDDLVRWMFAALEKHHICRVAIWQYPLSAVWMEQLVAMRKRCPDW
jgi:hypothetical protein